MCLPRDILRVCTQKYTFLLHLAFQKGNTYQDSLTINPQQDKKCSLVLFHRCILFSSRLWTIRLFPILCCYNVYSGLPYTCVTTHVSIYIPRGRLAESKEMGICKFVSYCSIVLSRDFTSFHSCKQFSQTLAS